jgi:UrcA family protein
MPSTFKTFLVAAGTVCLLGGAAAFAQDEGPAAGEQIIVTPPDYHFDRSGRGTLNKITLSRAVAYDDLDLGDPRDARVLRHRVVEAAQEVCAELRDTFPYREQPGEKCFNAAYRNALVRADAAIRNARY